MGYIYKATCKTTNQIYIGKSQSSVQERWKEHCRSAFLPSHGDYNFPFHRAIRKYGPEDFEIEVIDEVSDSEILKQKEKEWIVKYDSYHNGYNATLGGDGNCRYNYEAICDYYLNNGYSLKLTCQHFGVYDQVVYKALASQNIDYKNLQPMIKKTYNKGKKYIYCVELDKKFSTMKEIDNFLGKTAHPNIRRALNGITKKAYGYTWKEIDIEDDIRSE